MSSAASTPVPELFEEALSHHGAGRLGEAERLYRKILDINSCHADSWHLRGVIAIQTGDDAGAIPLIKKAIEIHNQSAAYFSNLGVAQKGVNQIKESTNSFRAALCLQPNYAEAQGNLGAAFFELGLFKEAASAYRTRLKISPRFIDAYSDLAKALKASGQLIEALQFCALVMAVDPGHFQSYHCLSTVLRDLGHRNKAVNILENAFKINPNSPEALSDLCHFLKESRRFNDAISACYTALRINPNNAITYLNLGIILADAGQFTDAITALATAIALKPDFLEAHNNLANGLKDLSFHRDSTSSYHHALSIKPDFYTAYSNLLMSLHYESGINNDAIFKLARDFASRVESHRDKKKFINGADPSRRLRIGYVSGDFRYHPVSYFLRRVLTNHNRRSFEIFCYNNNIQADDMTAHIHAHADHWRNLADVADDAAAQMIKTDQIDILIDLSGHTAFNRLSLFASKPSPVQATWIGYFGTTGLEAMDYIIGDRFVAPPSSTPYFTEEIWHLPESYLCYAPPEITCPVMPPPSQHNEFITFGSFNNHSKITSATIALWSRVLRALPSSKLKLKSKALDDLQCRLRLRDQFEEQGIDRSRIMFDGWSSLADTMAAYHQLDIALDTTPFGGGTTTADSLWMGVPVVSLRGETWVGRISESILSAIGAPELVASTPDDYVQIAVDLAGSKSRLASLRQNLRPRLLTNLCDGANFTRHLEHAYRSMWQTWCSLNK